MARNWAEVVSCNPTSNGTRNGCRIGLRRKVRSLGDEPEPDRPLRGEGHRVWFGWELAPCWLRVVLAGVFEILLLPAAQSYARD